MKKLRRKNSDRLTNVIINILLNVDVTPRVKRAHKWICEVKEWLAMQWDY